MIPKTGYRCFHSAADYYYYYYVPSFGFSLAVSDEPGSLRKDSPRSGLSRSPKSFLPRDSRSFCTSSMGRRYRSAADTVVAPPMDDDFLPRAVGNAFASAFRLGFLWSAMGAMTCTYLGAEIVEREKTMIFDLSSRVTAPWTCDQ